MMVTKEQIKQRFDELHNTFEDDMFRALDEANGLKSEEITQNIRFGVRAFYDSHDVEAMLRSTLAIVCKEFVKLHAIVEQLHGKEVVSSLDSDKIKEFLEFNENVEYIKELEKSL